MEIFAVIELLLLISIPTVPVIMVKIIDEHTIIETKQHGHDHSLLHRETRQKLINPGISKIMNGTADYDEIQLETYFILGKIKIQTGSQRRTTVE